MAVPVIASAVIIGITFLRDTTKLFYSLAKTCKKKRTELNEKVETLTSRINDVERRREEATYRDETVNEEADSWLRRSKELLEDLNARPSGFLGKYCWCCTTIERVERLDAMLAETGFQRVSDPRPPPPVVPRRIATDNNFKMASSVGTALGEVMAALKDGNTNVSVIGVHGIPGVGKTTMVKRAAAKALEEKLFERVVFSTVSSSPDLEKIQNEVAECLGITLRGDRASTIEDKIKREKKVLIVLDDVWEELDLSQVGIPNNSDLEKCDSKILLTTRIKHVCFVMGSRATIHLDIWSDQESREFLKTIATTNFKDTNGFEKIADEVADECKGLPLVLYVVAKALGDKPMGEWSRALGRLRNSELAHHDYGTRVFRSIKLSYDYLKLEAKRCFLLCCLFPEDHSIGREELARYAFGLDHFGHANSVDKARDETATIVEMLKDSGLLLPVDRDLNGERAKMHDAIRDVAIQIASSDWSSTTREEEEERQIFFVQAKKSNSSFQNKAIEHISKTCTAISVMYGSLRSLPDALDCPKLKTLLLQENINLTEIASTFFKNINALQVLNMSGTGSSSLPPSVEGLKMVRTLHIDRCKLSDISPIGKLESLAILSCRQSADIIVLPTELGQLRKLRMLDLTLCRKLTRIPPNVLSNMHSLEELYLKGSFCQWHNGENHETSQNASFSEVVSLSSLTILEVDIADAKSLPSQGDHVPNWVKFDICISNQELTRSMNMQPSSTRDYVYKNLLLETSIKDFPNWFIEAVSKKTEKVTYADAKRVNMFEEQANGRLAHLKSLMLDKYTWVYYLTWDISDSSPMFESLEELQIYDSSILEICDGDLPTGSFKSLESLTVNNCHEMGTTVLSQNFIKRVHNLSTLHVNRANARVVFDLFQNLDQGQRYLGKLREMRLKDLYELEAVWKGPAQFADFGNLKLVSVIKCEKLRNIFSVNILKGLSKLEDLWVEDCDKMEAIVGDDDEEINPETVTLRLPNLKTLCLSNLPKLEYFCSQNSNLLCPVLEYIHVHNCGDFQTPDFNSSKEVHRNDDQHMKALKKRIVQEYF